MSERIPQSVAKRVPLKAYLDTDHFSAATGKTIAVVISKNGAAFGNPSGGATNATEIANGWYYVDLSTTDTGTTGPLIVRGTNADIDDAEVIYEVANAHNAGFDGVPNAAADAAGGLPISDAGGLDLDARLDASITSRLAPTTAGRTLDVTATGAAGVDWGNVENQSTAVNLSATNIDADQVVASVSGAVGSVTGNVGGNVTGSIGSLATQAKADVNAEADAALVDVRLDELLAADSDIDGAAPPTVGSVFHELMSKTTGSFTFDQTTDSLEAIRDKETDIETDTQDIQGRLPASLVSGRIDASVGAMASGVIAAASFAAGAFDAVWTVTTRELTAFSSSFKTGYSLSSAGVQAVWDALTSALTTVGSIGKLLVDNINATISSRSSHNATDVWAVGTRALTDKANFTLHSDYDAAKTAATQASVNDLPTNAELASALAPLALEASLQDVPTATENADTLLKRDMSAVTGESARSPLNALRALRNKVSISGGTVTVTKEDDTTSAWTAVATTSPSADPITSIDPS